LVESPFFLLAGVKRNALAHSIVATGVTVIPMFLAAWLLLIVGWNMHSELLLLLWIPGSVAVSSGIKYAWLNRRRSSWRGIIKAWPILIGATTSAAVVALLPLLQMVFGFDDPAHAANVAEARRWAAVLMFGGAVCALVIAASRARDDRVDVGRIQPHGFEVLPPVQSDTKRETPTDLN
jgi:hypothetical protein